MRLLGLLSALTQELGARWLVCLVTRLLLGGRQRPPPMGQAPRRCGKSPVLLRISGSLFFPFPSSESRPSSRLPGQCFLSCSPCLQGFPSLSGHPHDFQNDLRWRTSSPTCSLSPVESKTTPLQAFQALGSGTSPHFSGHISFPCPGEAGRFGSQGCQASPGEASYKTGPPRARGPASSLCASLGPPSRLW